MTVMVFKYGDYHNPRTLLAFRDGVLFVTFMKFFSIRSTNKQTSIIETSKTLITTTTTIKKPGTHAIRNRSKNIIIVT